MILKAPYPYFGGKSRVSSLVWERIGDATNFVDPFFGSNAILLSRPHWNAETGQFDGDRPWRTETVNDANGYIANFWRAVQYDPEAVAHYADWPVNENDLHARHLWLIRQASPEWVERMTTDPDFYDAKIAGWWVWGACQWIGSGWCDLEGYVSPSRQRPNLRPWQGVEVKRRPSRTIPHLGGTGDRGRGIHAWWAKETGIGTLMLLLSARLHNVRVTCGDWTRVLGPSPTHKIGVTGIVLDPPYSTDVRKSDLYAVDDTGDVPLSTAVREWAIENGDNPRLRIALFGYEAEHGPHMPASWDCVEWTANGGYSNQNGDGNDNRTQERVWFSPHCIRPVDETPPLIKMFQEATP